MEFNKTDFKKHQLIHSATSFKCDQCDAAFKHLKHRDNHMENKHETRTANDWEERTNVTKKLNFDDDKKETRRTPKKEAKTPKKDTQTPKRETKTPKRETKTPKRETKTPKRETKTPKRETKGPKKETQTPKKETQTQKKETKTPKKETKTPKKETKTPRKFKNLKVDNCIGCKKSFSSVENLMMHMKTSQECRKKQKSSLKQLADPKSNDLLTTDDAPKLGRTIYPSEERRTSFENIFPKTVFGSAKPKKIAYVKPQIKEVPEDVCDSRIKKRDNGDTSVELNLPLLQQDQALDEDKFKCDPCGDKFVDMWGIKEHFLSTHNSEEMYHDFRRKKKQKTKMLMQQARLVNQNSSGEIAADVSPVAELTERANVTFPCEFCDERFPSLKSLKKHTLTHHEQPNENGQEQIEEDGAAMNSSRANISNHDQTEQNAQENFEEEDIAMDISVASSDGSFLDTSDNIQDTKTVRKRKSSCQKCKACKADDCGVCVYCKDKPKFGGPSKMKQKCLRRICLEGDITKSKRLMLKRLEKELEMSIESKKKKKSEAVLSAKNDQVNECNEEKSKAFQAEKEGKSPGIKLKIKLKSSTTKSDRSDKWASEIILPREHKETTSPKKRINDGESAVDESKVKKIKRETKDALEVDEQSDAIPSCTQEELDKLIKSEVQDISEMPNHLDTEVSAKSTTRDEVDKLIKSEVEEILEMQRSFSEDLKNLIKIDGGNLDIENELSVPILPPKTPKKYLENTIEKLTNRIVKDSLNMSENNDDLAEEKVLDMLLQDAQSCSDSLNKSTIEELEVAEMVETDQHLDNLGFVIRDITKPDDDATIFTLYPSAISATQDLDSELEKFEKLKLISTRLVSGELSLASASSFTGLRLPVLRCWLESLEQVLASTELGN